MTDRSVNGAERRAQILSASVRVFARRGYHGCRVGEIAEEAGVAHGLLYHYFRSKEDVLETIFRESWSGLVAAIEAVADSGEPADEQLKKAAAIMLRSWRDDPDLVRVLIREIARSPQLQREIGEIDRAFRALERIVVRGQDEGSLRADVDPRLASFIFYGAVEELLTGWVFGHLPAGDAEVARAEQTLVEIVRGGLAGTPVSI